MMASYQATGVIKDIYETQTFPSGFTKREFIVECGDGNYPNPLKFELIKDKCEWLDRYATDQTVTVSFDIRGNEFKDKYYVNLNAWKIEGEQQAQPQQPAPSQPAPQSTGQQAPSQGEGDNESIPF